MAMNKIPAFSTRPGVNGLRELTGVLSGCQDPKIHLHGLRAQSCMKHDFQDYAGLPAFGAWMPKCTDGLYIGFTDLNPTGARPAGCTRAKAPKSPNALLRHTGSCVVRLDGDVLLHVLHVNTVGNQQFHSQVFSRSLRRYAEVQSNTTKTHKKTRLSFVSDKKRLCSQHGYKNTCIEFTGNMSKSSNYTSNAAHSLQSYFRSTLETVSLSQGRAITSAKAFTVSNENLTCYIYGVANPAAVVLKMKMNNAEFHTPFFFSSVNVCGSESHQLFPSMAINSQKVKNAELELPKSLNKVAHLVELHVHLNRLCCQLAQERRGMLTSQEKLCLLYLTETWFFGIEYRSAAGYWTQYSHEVGQAFLRKYKSSKSPHQDKVLMNYHFKNPEFAQLAIWLLKNPSEKHHKMILDHERYLRVECKLHARAELIVTVWDHVKRHSISVPDGFPPVSSICFQDLGYSEQTLRESVSRSGSLFD